MDEFITVGQIVRAVGIRGEVKVKPLTDDKLRFADLKIVYIRKKPYKIAACRFDKDHVYLGLHGVYDRTEAEKLKDVYLEIDRINAVPLDEGSYFIADVEGCKLFTDDGNEIGRVTDVSQYGAADVFTVVGEKKTVCFPFLKKMIVKVDVEAGIIIVKRSIFDEVSVYED